MKKYLDNREIYAKLNNTQEFNYSIENIEINLNIFKKYFTVRCGKCNNILIKKYERCPYCKCLIDWNKYDNIRTSD